MKDFRPPAGRAGVLLPPDGYLQGAADLCRKNDSLFILDEIQTGWGRTGKLFAWEWEGARPDILGVFRPGDHGSTFGGNPLACTVARAALEVLLDENLAARAHKTG